MQAETTNIQCLVPGETPAFETIFGERAREPFCEEVMALLGGLSARLMKDREAKQYPDVVAFAFWCRPQALADMRTRYARPAARLGRGVVFHVAPSNVPVNFAYSLVAGLLAGNVNIVRVPSQEFPQVEIICSALRSLLEQPEFAGLANYVTLLRYEKNAATTGYFSANCDVRVIWGGDETIADIRRSPLPARSTEITFADRYSLCVINADAYPGEADPAQVAEGFYNDTYLFDQNACTAPHLVAWVGSEARISQARETFWNQLHAVAARKYELQPVSAVDKLTNAYRFAATSGDCTLEHGADNLVVRVHIDKLLPGIEAMRSTCGYFYECDVGGIEDLLPIINRKFQTLVYFGFESAELEQFVSTRRPSGIDRIVPIGRSLDFSLTWDGVDLIGGLSRVVSVS